jgi:hypothetical protein
VLAMCPSNSSTTSVMKKHITNGNNMLRAQRNRWRKRFEQGDKHIALFLNDYRRNRDREDWRMSTQAEEVCEYVLWLESKLEVIENEP